MNDPFGISKAAPMKAAKTLTFKKPKISGPEMGGQGFTTPGMRVHEDLMRLQDKAKKKKGFLRRMK